MTNPLSGAGKSFAVDRRNRTPLPSRAGVLGRNITFSSRSSVRFSKTTSNPLSRQGVLFIPMVDTTGVQKGLTAGQEDYVNALINRP